MDDEYQFYHQSGSFARFLASWLSSNSLLSKRISQLAKGIVQAGFWRLKEVDIVNAWLTDLRSIGYIFPLIVTSPSSSRTSIKEKRIAVCVTGIVECIQEGWVPTYNMILNSLQGDIDTFVFLSSSHKLETIRFSVHSKNIRSYLNSTATIIYDDRIIDPQIPSNCTIFY
ncbi:unnamed protein product [Rotaria socialis]|uniref:Uncharacterized protein n=1 Tax=Rotaria socialis TaxID=392032 RepID=A0A820JD71_9BILA|nr:unnamed protein product [Rotaria socialis]CAF3729364.1 unnamed protein product [Rotaria socialis]CAF3736427.1 unnamed protein product [Rotaria socialis]CAF4322851.1 unnamed protein product [Rotaria socialis]CAF4669487.1 unnamed protein product [Rotaria socialis]